MTVAKLVTGEDRPLSNMEWVLTNTYHLVVERLKQQRGKGR